MPNRILRPWLDSEAVNSLGDAEEVFFVRLIMAADDYGRFHGSPPLLKAFLYPLKDIRVSDIPRLIAACVKAGLILDYEVSGKRYLQIINFKQRLRVVHESKFPAPPEGLTDTCQTDDRQTTVMRPSSDRHMRGGDEDGDEDENKMDSDKSSSITPEPGEMPGNPGKRKPRIFFDYEGDARIHGITAEQLQYWRETYPAINVDAELKAASAWLDANRKNRKSDVKRFLVNWLKRTQDRAPRVPDQPEPRQHGKEWDI